MSRYVYKGSLKDQNLIESVATINYHQVSGILQVSYDSHFKKVYFVEGNIVASTSSLESDRLGEFLLRSGIITEAQLDSALHEAEVCQGAKRIGQILVDQGALTPKQLVNEVKNQGEATVVNLFSLQEGKVIFTCGAWESKGIVRLQYKTKNLLYEGVRKYLNEVQLKERIQSISRVVHPTPALGRLRDEFEGGKEETKILAGVDGKKNIAELVRSSAMNTFDTLKFIYFMLVTRAIE